MYYNTKYYNTNQGDFVFLKNLVKIRKVKGLTQEGLARKADISFHTLIKIERERIKNPRIGTVIKLAKALEVSIDKLVER